MATRSSPEDVRDRVLDATETLLAEQGLASTTLDAVANAASISKGGLLHHFSSKEKLIEAMVDRATRRWRDDVRRAIEVEVPGAGRVARALLRQCLQNAETFNDRCRDTSAAMMAAMMHQPGARRPLQAFYGELLSMLDHDGLPQGVGTVVLAAIDGIWFTWVTGIAEATEHRCSTIRQTLEQLIQWSTSGGDVATGTLEVSHR
jgi:AcrR family transcriptional regulator